MEILQAIRSRRSIRRFQDRPIDGAVLTELADLARLYVTGGNQQPIRCGIVSQQPLVEAVFHCLKWAMYLPDFEILPSQRPQAYIVLFAKNNNLFECGSAATTLLLACQAFGLSACTLQVPDRAQMRKILDMDGSPWQPIVAIALGYAGQESKAVPYVDSIQYTEDENGNIQVPKFSLDETLLFRK